MRWNELTAEQVTERGLDFKLVYCLNQWHGEAPPPAAHYIDLGRFIIALCDDCFRRFRQEPRYITDRIDFNELNNVLMAD